MSFSNNTILVLFGGCSTEYGVSLQSAAAVLAHFPPAYTPLPVGITRDGRWLRYFGPADALPADRWQKNAVPCTLSLDRGGCALLWLDGSHRREEFAAAFPVLHGKNGEGGTVQGVFELAGVPVIGCGVLPSALCMDKDRAHKLAALAGIAVPKSAKFDRGAAAGEIAAAAESIGWPLFVKPVRAGSSFGISRIEGPEALETAVAAAFEQDSEILLEEAVPGFEVGCAVLGLPEGELTVGEVDEIELSQGFFDFEEKYTLKTSAIHCPARIPVEKAAAIKAAACKVYRALGCRVFARIDLFLTPDGKIIFNEANTIPGFTAHSRYPGMMRAAGLEFEPLLAKMIELGVQPA